MYGKKKKELLSIERMSLLTRQINTMTCPRKKAIMFFTIGFFIELIILLLISLSFLVKKKNDLTQKWREYDHRKLLSAETKLIEIAKWIEGEKIHHDPGRTETEKNAFVIQWIKEHAADVRKAWEVSQCRVCSKNCFHNMKRDCGNFIEDKNVKAPKKGAFIFWIILALIRGINL